MPGTLFKVIRVRDEGKAVVVERVADGEAEFSTVVRIWRQGDTIVLDTGEYYHTCFDADELAPLIEALQRLEKKSG